MHTNSVMSPPESNRWATASEAKLRSDLRSFIESYPPDLRETQSADIDRIVFHIQLIARRCRPDSTICDVGGGIGLFSLGCAALGFNVILADDFADEINRKVGSSILDIHRSQGITVVSRDVVEAGVDLDGSSVDVVTIFDSMEHWHHSPKGVLRSLINALTPSGLVVIGVPNNVNLRKRLTVPFGRGAWSPIEAWYEPSRFRGHVREPDVHDLDYIARDLELVEWEIHGRNWLGCASSSAWMRRLTPFVDRALRRFPQLCSNIYLVGRRS